MTRFTTFITFHFRSCIFCSGEGDGFLKPLKGLFLILILFPFRQRIICVTSKPFLFPRFSTTSVCYILTPNKWSVSGLYMQLARLPSSSAVFGSCSFNQALSSGLTASVIICSMITYSLRNGHTTIEVPTGPVSPLNKILSFLNRCFLQFLSYSLEHTLSTNFAATWPLLKTFDLCKCKVSQIEAIVKKLVICS